MARSRLPVPVSPPLPRAALVLALIAVSAPAGATDVVVRVSGVVGRAGAVRVGICLPPEYEHRRCSRNAAAAARPGTVEVTVLGVPAGRYAVIAHHDRAGDREVHTNWLGIPTDGVGVSRNAEGRFGPPGFDQVALDITGARVVVDITLRQEPEE